MVSFSDFLNSNHDFLRFVSKQFSDKYFFSDNQVQLLIRYEPGSYQQMKLFQQKVLSTVLRVMGSKYKVRSDFRLMRHYLVKTNILSEGLMSLGVCLLVLFFLFVAYYHSLKVGVLAMCPSILTMIALCGLLCALGWPFTVSSVSAAIIVLTVGIDFTIHLFIKHRHLSEYMKDSSDVFKELFSRLLAPLAISAVCVSAPLLFCLFSSFIPLVRLAVLISSGVLLALVINVLVCAVIFKKISPKTLYR